MTTSDSERRTASKTLLYSGAMVGLFVAANIVLIVTGDQISWSSDLTGLGILVGLALLAGLLEIRLPTTVSFAFAVDSAFALAMAIMFGPITGAASAMLVTLVLDVTMRREPIKVLVNVFGLGLSTLTAGWVYGLIAPPGDLDFSNGATVVAVLAASVAYTLVNSWSLVLIVSTVVDASALSLWLGNVRPLAIEMVTIPTLGSIVPILHQQHSLAPVLLIVPLLGPFFAFRALRQVEEETRKTMESLADALEQRDPYTSQHSIRVTAYTSQILAQMPDIPMELRDSIIAAARVHDVGKIGTRDDSLLKPGKLSPEQVIEIQRHPGIGAEIVGHLSIYRDEAALVRHHHERWDGTGYPDRLSGVDIPFGARVIAVADAFDAMTSDRVYRPALSFEAAFDIVRREAGAQFDPDIVIAFERAMADQHARQPFAARPAASPLATAS